MKLFALFTLGVIALTAATNTTEAPANVNTTAAPANANTTEASANANTTEASNNVTATTASPASNTTAASTPSTTAAPASNTTAAPASNTTATTAAPASNTTAASNNTTATTAAPASITTAASDAATTVAPVDGEDLKVEIVSSIVFADALNDTMQTDVKVAFCTDVKSTLVDLGASTVVPTCTIAVSSRRRRLLAVSYDLKAVATVPAASGTVAITAISAGLDNAITSLNTKLLENPTLKAANGNANITVTTVKSLTSVPASTLMTTVAAGSTTLDSGTGRACMVPSAIVFVLASSLFN